MTPDEMGVLVAREFKWDGVQIIAAFLAALEDANFHEMGATIEALAKAEGLA
jgi:hypothetical protein